MGGRTDDVEAFKRGDEDELFHPKSTKDVADLLQAIASAKVPDHRRAANLATSRSPISTRRATSGRTDFPGASSRTC